MNNINLSQVSQQRKEDLSKGTAFNKTVLLSLFILILALGVSFGSQFYADSLETDKTNVLNQITEQSDKLSYDKVGRVTNFQHRLGMIDTKMKDPQAPEDILDKVAKAIMPSVTLTSYSYDLDHKTIALVAVTDNLKNAAQQILSLKKASFTSVEMESGKKNDTGLSEFSLKVGF